MSETGYTGDLVVVAVSGDRFEHAVFDASTVAPFYRAREVAARIDGDVTVIAVNYDRAWVWRSSFTQLKESGV